MNARLQRLFEAIERQPLSLGTFVVTLLAIIAVRIGIEHFFESVPFRFADQFFYQFSHHFFTFSTIFLLALPLIAWAGRVHVSAAAKILLAGFLVIWTPPIIDEIISNGIGLWSFYSFDSLTGLLERYVTFFGDKPDVGITYGVRFEVALVTLLATVYAWVKSRSLIRALGAGLALYTVLFLIGILPSIATLLLLGPELGFLAVTEHDVARLMLSPAPLFVIYPPDVTSVLAIKMSLIYGLIYPIIIAGLVFGFFRPIFWALLRNARFPQIIYHVGLFAIGAGLTFLYGETSWKFDFFHIAGVYVLAVAVISAWLASVVVNDCYDQNIDRVTNPSRPLISGTIDITTYRTIGLLFFASSVFFAGLVSTQAALLLVVYQALAFLYSADPLRLKRFPIIATALAALASLLVLFAGFIAFSADKNIMALPNSIIAFLFFAYLAALPLKDFKDIAGDRADGVRTLPVLLGEERAKRVIGGALFIAFVASPFVLSLRSLFPLSVFFGALAFWVVHLGAPEHRYFTYRKLPAWLLVIAIGYGCFLALTLSGR